MKDKGMKIIPQGKRLLVQLKPVKEKVTKGGIVLPDTHSEETRIGSIIAVGDEVDRIEPLIFRSLWNFILEFFTNKDYRKKEYNPGDKILVAFFSGTPLHFPTEGILDDTVRIIVQSEIMAKIEE